MPLRRGDYLLRDELGEGTFGLVRLGTHVPTGRDYAVKEMKVSDNDKEQGVPVQALREISLLRQFHHPNVVRAVDFLQEADGTVLLVLPLCDTDLHCFIRNRTDSSACTKRSLAGQLLRGVEYLHTLAVAHRDLKPGNLLVQKKDGGGWRLLVSDLGGARRMYDDERAYTPNVGTVWYRAPEVFLGEGRYGIAIDVWSCGCVISELCTNRVLFKGETDADMICLIVALVGPPDADSPLWHKWESMSTKHHIDGRPPPPTALRDAHPGTCDRCVDLLSYMLRMHGRVSARQAAQHPYFAADDEEDVSMT